tara:strand:- start:1506 stop:3386 length:1881 start_codon:yes stop_codon:yes gene_type:complete
MLSNLGITLIVFILLTTISLVYICFFELKKNEKLVSKKIYQLSLFQSTFSILTFFTLIMAFVISDFSLINVFQNSHTNKPFFYKIAGSWGSHEGSLLLWINILVIFSYLFLIYNKVRDKNFRLYTLIVQNLLILGFVFFLLINSNPFSSIFPVPDEGLGLNPILQDPALAIHPPLLYIGFVGCSIYFSAAIASMISNFRGKEFAQSIKSWILISWSFQTLGIIVGSIWAYYELGWGGFWFWDPVENASLLPWFAITALVHSVIILEKRNSAYNWVIILCLLTFILSVTGTFLVRSGVLNSVHTFASDPSRGLYILVFLSLMIFFSIIIFFKNYKKNNYDFNANSKETFILINNWFMMFFLVSVLIGTLYPIFAEVINQTKISVGPPFYNIVIIPLVVPLLILMGVGPRIQWIKNNLNISKQLTIIIFSAIGLNFLIFFLSKSYSPLSNLIIISSISLILYSLIDLFHSFKKKINYNLPQIISHFSFSLLIFFIGINHIYSTEIDFNLKVGEQKKFDNYNISFNSLDLENRKNYKAIVGKFLIQEINTNNENILKPEIRIYNQPETITYEASIKSGLTSDLYLTMSNISRSEYYNLKFQNKPFMIWIWISALSIALGGFLRLFKRRH